MNADESYAKAMAAYNLQTFKRRVYRCESEEKLRAIASHEHVRDGEVRTERIKLAMKRLQKIKDSDS